MSDGNSHNHDPLPIVLAGRCRWTLRAIGTFCRRAHADVEPAGGDAGEAGLPPRITWAIARRAGDLTTEARSGTRRARRTAAGDQRASARTRRGAAQVGGLEPFGKRSSAGFQNGLRLLGSARGL